MQCSARRMLDGKWSFDDSLSLPYEHGRRGCSIDPRQRCRSASGDATLRHPWQWRWQPHGAELAPLDAERFARFSLQHPVTFIGDSLMRNEYQSLVCLLGEQPHNVSYAKSSYLVDAARLHQTPPPPNASKPTNTNTHAERVFIDRADQLVRLLRALGACSATGDRAPVPVVVLGTGHWYAHEGVVCTSGKHQAHDCTDNDSRAGAAHGPESIGARRVQRHVRLQIVLASPLRGRRLEEWGPMPARDQCLATRGSQSSIGRVHEYARCSQRGTSRVARHSAARLLAARRHNHVAAS